MSVLDTAGMRAASDVVERLGVQRSQTAAVQADVALLILDAQVSCPKQPCWPQIALPPWHQHASPCCADLHWNCYLSISKSGGSVAC